MFDNRWHSSFCAEMRILALYLHSNGQTPLTLSFSLPLGVVLGVDSDIPQAV